MVCVLIIAAYSVFLLISIFQKERYNLDMATQEIRAYQADENWNFHNYLTNCESGNCKDILVSDWEEVCDESSFEIKEL